jgi:hypothetical protein
LTLALTFVFPAALHADATQTVRGEMAVPAGHFTVENLIGSMKVTTGGDRITAVATVRAETEEIAREIRFEQGTDRHGLPVLRLRYPFGRSTTYRFPESRPGRRSWPFDGDHKGWTTEYGGRRDVRLSTRSGLRVEADLEVQVPARALDAMFRNVVGPIEGTALQGKVRLDTGSGDVTFRGGSGDLVADTGSGHVLAQDVEGRFNCDTGSGTCDVRGFKGDALRCDTGSGEVIVSGARARRVVLDTGSGEVHVTGSEAEDVSVDTGSGDVEIETSGARLARVSADTGSGSVHLRLGSDAEFEARAEVGGGEIVNRYPDAQPIVRRDEVVGYRRGSGRIRINVDTGSGDVVIEPGH